MQERERYQNGVKLGANQFFVSRRPDNVEQLQRVAEVLAASAGEVDSVLERVRVLERERRAGACTVLAKTRPIRTLYRLPKAPESASEKGQSMCNVEEVHAQLTM